MILFGKKDKLQIITFKTYGTATHLYVRGRALEDENIDLSQKGFFQLLWNTWKRFETDEIKYNPLTIQLPNATTVSAKTNGDGYYRIDEAASDLSSMTDSEGWLEYTISYSGSALGREISNENRFSGEMLIPAQTADFGVISDIDDTILHTGVVSSLKWRVVLNTVFTRAVTRKPLEGMAEFYHRLHGGKSGNRANPIFYVSHSPWNLYRYLEVFLGANNFPKGPVILRSMASFSAHFSKSQIPEKQKEIINILKTYPTLKFILIGDSGERDADIYMEVARANPNRILTIYLRSVQHKRRMHRVRRLLERFKGTPVILVTKTEDALAHARQKGFIAKKLGQEGSSVSKFPDKG
ncbi:MAG: phosphatase domain-containing protein [Bacteroidota bacterium]